MHPDATCWHEAGHALVAHLLGAEVRRVTLESEFDDHEGHTEIAWRGDLSPHDRSRNCARTAIAGPIAELAFRGTDDLGDPRVLTPWRNDWAEFEACLVPLVADPTEREALRRELVLEVRRTLETPEMHERLARIADMLAAHGTLDETLFCDAIA